MTAFRLELIGFLCGLAALRQKQKQSLAKAQSRKGNTSDFGCGYAALRSLRLCEKKNSGFGRLETANPYRAVTPVGAVL